MNKKILLGITGSIAAYKSADIASGLVGMGYDVQVVMTSNAVRFISPLTLETLTKNKVYVDMFDDEDHSQVTHINLATESDLILIVPASYNIIGKAASGIADDLLCSIIAASPGEKIIIAPAMNVNMYSNPILNENINLLKKCGVSFIEPEEGRLACGVIGKGRLRNIPSILEEVDLFFCEKPLKGLKVMVTAGATREYIDPIRFISNSSSGLMGVSLAKACKKLGADVTLILANSHYDLDGMKVIKVDTASQMYEAVIKHYEDMDLIFASAAVSDFEPLTYSSEKIKKKTKTNLILEFKQNTDILLELGRLKKNQFLVGFAAESENMFDNAINKLSKKNLDMIIANDLSNFSSKEAKVWLISHEETIELKKKDKEELAYDIVRKVIEVANFSKEGFDEKNS